MKVAIVGLGYVGKNMLKLFPDAVCIDPPQKIGYFSLTEGCDLAIVCVPTPMADDGSCDTSIVESVIPKIKSDLILIRSAVTPGTSDKLARLRKGIVVSPEYLGESKYYTPPEYPHPTEIAQHGFMILGGTDDDCSRVADIFLPVLGPCTRFRFMTRTEAEIVKYAENSFFAVKVTFANQLRDICEAAGVNYHRVREGWIDDPRVGPMHTAAFNENRGFDGKCLPKDSSAFRHYANSLGVETILTATIESNEKR